MQRRNIVFFIGDMSLPGGTEQACATVASGLQRAGHRVSVLSMHGGHRSHFELDPAISLSTVLAPGERRSQRPYRVTRALRNYTTQRSIDVWIDAESVLASTSLPALIGIRRTHVTWENFNASRHVGSYVRPIARRLAARNADRIIVLTEFDRQLWQRKYKPNAKITHIPNALNTVSDKLLSQARPADREPVILASGRLCHQKGFDQLLHAWHKACDDFPSWTLRIIGDGPDKASLQQLCRHLQLDERVEWGGFQSDVAREYRRAGFFCLSSRFEGFGLVVIEAMAAGLPVVAFDCDAGPGEIVDHGETGLLIRDGDIEGMAEALKQAMADAQWRKTASILGQHRVRRFSWAQIAPLWASAVQ